MPATAKQLAAALVDVSADATPADARKAVEALIQKLAGQRRLGAVPRVIRALDRVWRERFGAARITVTSAAALPKAELDRLQQLAPGADLTAHVDPAVIGGAIVRLDDKLLDGSVAGALGRLSDSLIHGS